MAQKHIDVYIDVQSLYSLFAFFHLQSIRPLLASHNITLSYHPIFLGGVMQLSGNSPPWTLPARGKMGNFDSARAQRYFKQPVTLPKFFPINSLLNQRALCWIKANRPEKLEDTFAALYRGMWQPAPGETGLNVGKAEDLLKALTKDGLWSKEEAEGIIAAAQTPEVKALLNANTEKAVKLGAYGAPWFWVTNAEGKSEPFFGSDRFHYMWDFLDVPHMDHTLKEAGAKL